FFFGAVAVATAAREPQQVNARVQRHDCVRAGCPRSPMMGKCCVFRAAPEETAIVRLRRNAPPAALALGNAADRQRLRGVFRRSGNDAGAAANLAAAAMGDGAGERLRLASGAAAATYRSGPAAVVHS